MICQILAPTSGDYFLRVSSPDSDSFGSYGIWFEPAIPDDHANDPSGATSVLAPSSTNGEIAEPSDQDWFSFDASSGTNYHLEISLGTLPDSTLALYDRDGGTQLEFNDDIDYGGGNLASAIDWNAPQSGTYFVRAAAFQSITGSYTLHISESVASVPIPEPPALCCSVELALLAVAALRFRGDGRISY